MALNTKHVETLRKLREAAPGIEGMSYSETTAFADALSAAIDALEPYNGWTNRETWAVALHIDNNQWSHHWRNDIIGEVKALPNSSHISVVTNQHVWTDEQFLLFTTETRIKDWVEAMFNDFLNQHEDGELGLGQEQLNDVRLMISDVGSLWRVNWREIAENFLDE